MRIIKQLFFILLCPVLLASCIATPQTRQLLSEPPDSLTQQSFLLNDIPFYPQELYQCGPAALATVLGASGVDVSPDTLVSRVYIPEREGSLQAEMLAAPRAYGRLSYNLPAELQQLLEVVHAGHPVLVMQNLGLSWYPQWHYAVVTGYDMGNAELILNSGTIQHYRMPIALFEKTWHRAEHWAVLVLEPGEQPLAVSPEDYLEALSAMQRSADGSAVEKAYLAGKREWPSAFLMPVAYGNFLYGQQKLADAAENYRQALALNPDYAPAHNNLAQVLLETGESALAEQHARRAVALGGSHQAVYQSTLDSALQQLSSPDHRARRNR